MRLRSTWMMMPLMFMIGACIGVSEDDQPALEPALESKSAGQALMSPLDRRRIPYNMGTRRHQ